MQYVYVLNKHGNPLMPCSPRKARLLLKQKKSMRYKTHTVYSQTPVWKYGIQTACYFGRRCRQQAYRHICYY